MRRDRRHAVGKRRLAGMRHFHQRPSPLPQLSHLGSTRAMGNIYIYIRNIEIAVRRLTTERARERERKEEGRRKSCSTHPARFSRHRPLLHRCSLFDCTIMVRLRLPSLSLLASTLQLLHMCGMQHALASLKLRASVNVDVWFSRLESHCPQRWHISRRKQGSSR